MLESYFEEVHKRRIIARVFWGVVFIFAVLLFFFFKGYYFSLDIGFKALSSSSGSVQGEKENDPQTIIKQFGVAHIITSPRDAKIIFDNESLNSGERKIIDYGQHTVSYEKKGYIGGEREVYINQEIPYFMDKISLVSDPKYQKTVLDLPREIYQVSDTNWLSLSQSGAWIFSDNFETKKKVTFKKGWKYIGDRVFSDGASLVVYNDFGNEFQVQKNPEIRKFLKGCKESKYQYNFLSCRNHSTVIDTKAHIFTGVVDRGRNFIQQKNTLTLYGDEKFQKFALTGALKDSKIFVEIDDNWYFEKSGSLVSVIQKSDFPEFSFGTDSLFFAQKIQDYYVLLGKKGETSLAIVFDPKHELVPNIISLPSLDWKDIKITESENTLFIKTRTALIFFYKKDSLAHWITTGTILAFDKNFALYSPENGEDANMIWRADWKIGE